MKIKRRDFLALMGLSGAAATIGCGNSPEEKWHPWVEPTEGDIPYVPRYYATVTRESGGQSLWVKTVNGRAQKIEGNPDSPINQGKISARAQAAVQGLYSPERIQTPLKDGKKITWREANDLLNAKLEENKGKNVSALTGPSSGSVNKLWTEFVANAGTGKLVQFEALSRAAMAAASEKAFGVNAIPYVSLKGSDYILSMGAAFLETWGDSTAQSRDYADFRDVKHGKRGAHIQVEARMSMTGASADSWLAAKPGSETVIVLALLKEVAAHAAGLNDGEKAKVAELTGAVSIESAATASGLSAEKLKHVADALGHARSAVVLPSETLALGDDVVQHHVAVLLLNKALGGIGKHYNYEAGISAERVVSHREIDGLIKEMQAGSVDMLVVKDANPAYALPQGAGFNAAFEKVGFTVAFADVPNETTALADLVIPVRHDLESWGEISTYNGVDMLMQPVMRTRWDVRQAEDFLIDAINKGVEGEPAVKDFKTYLEQEWVARLGGESLDKGKFWRDCLRKGGRFQMPENGSDLPVSDNLNAAYFGGVGSANAGDLALVLFESPRFGDGSTANRGWMQELPDAMSGVVWDSWLEMSNGTAKNLGVKNGDHVTVNANGQSVEIPAFVVDTIADHVVSLQTGQGHTHYGKLYERGVNAFGFLKADLNEAGLYGAGPMTAKLSRAAGKTKMATFHVPGKGDRIHTPQTFTKPGDPHFDRDLFQSTKLNGGAGGHGGDHGGDDHGGGHHEEVNLDSTFPIHTKKDFYADRGETPVVVGRDEKFYDPYKWELNIDLNRCHGCGSCVTACYAENNIPVVGKDQVIRGREMAWIRVNRYIEFSERYHGEPKARFLPMMCQQCGSAPCETVCPTLATYHSKEGLNAMVYNRCVGTRYCSNNCTYKVRRFNWFDFEFEGDLNWQLNPAVSHRGRGVMEKCTFCVQRIRDGKDKAKDENRLVRDGEIQTACQQACPSNAISFGNASDSNSTVAHKAHDKRAYRALDHHLHTRPGVSYLQRVDLGEEKHG